jgi:tRNA U34 5-methylaminomethyl-2-thiouridine-forming methyltransferase MnmC
VVFTMDGSHSLWSSKFKEEYHSSRGAIIETEHTYINMGLRPKLESGKPSIRIFELSLGTGLTAIMTALAADKTTIRYDTIEPYPLPKNVLAGLNYTQYLHNSNELFKAIHDVEWGKEMAISDTFFISKYKAGIESFALEPNHYDVIYMDAFSPKIQPDVWSESVMNKLYLGLVPGGHIVTYCAAGFVRRYFESLGGKAERLRGANGKREMLRITKMG